MIITTSVPGSGQWFERGFITYSVHTRKYWGVSPITLDKYGAVSEQTATEMVWGALNKSHTHLAVAITGLAGPDKGAEHNPVGTVCFAWGNDVNTQTLTG